jgi:DNA invertase Pin-like site-specific DNA recombinase
VRDGDLPALRLSTSEQNEGVSLDTQAQQIAGYAMMKGWQVAEYFIERGVSGSIPLVERPEGSRLLTTAGKGDGHHRRQALSRLASNGSLAVLTGSITH